MHSVWAPPLCQNFELGTETCTQDLEPNKNWIELNKKVEIEIWDLRIEFERWEMRYENWVWDTRNEIWELSIELGVDQTSSKSVFGVAIYRKLERVIPESLLIKQFFFLGWESINKTIEFGQVRLYLV